MTTVRSTFVFIWSLTITSAFGQYLGYSRISESSVSKWIPQSEEEYYGTYRFGDSEGESTLLLFSTGAEIIGQIKTGAWNEDGTAWIWIYDNLSNISIDKLGRFTSDQYNGEFTYYSGEGHWLKCLKIYDSWSGVTENETEYELGPKESDMLDGVYPGKFKLASSREIDPKELTEMSSDDLQIMRNEIFARYGYKFREGGKMQTYFKQQPWYRAQHSNVNDFLTTVEKRNIQLIRTEEKRR